MLIPVPPRAPPTLLSLSVLVGRDGVVTRSPSRTPKYAVVSVLTVKANSPRRFQPKCSPYNHRPPTCAHPAMISDATVTPPRRRSKFRKRPSVLITLLFSGSRDILDPASPSSPSPYQLLLPTVYFPDSVWNIREFCTTNSAASGSHYCSSSCDFSS